VDTAGAVVGEELAELPQAARVPATVRRTAPHRPARLAVR